MRKIIVVSIGTDAGKTVVSAALVRGLHGEYWKPVQCGCSPCDTSTVKNLAGPIQSHPESYRFSHSVSPHHAARLENVHIDAAKLTPPFHTSPLIIEGCGGLLVPLRNDLLLLDLFKKWEAEWILVSRHYIGSINHTLLSLEALKHRNIPLTGIIFNGDENPDTESVILQHAQVKFWGRLRPESNLTPAVVQRYGETWKNLF